MMKKLLGMLMMALIMITLMVGCGTENDISSADEQLKLGIIQIVEHPSLDAARQGFLDVLQEQGYEEGTNLMIDYQNAQNDQANLQTIARKFVHSQSDLVLSIATPSAMTMANETADLPILFTAVTDPISAKLVQSLEKPGGNVTGTTDINPVKDQLKLIKDLVPKTKKVGIIYNASEINSQIQVEIAEQAAPELGIELVKVTVTASNEVMQAAQSMIGKVDALYLP
jgi:putative ABC transport system substrate-binding protein